MSREAFQGIHQRLLTALESEDGGTFELDAWSRPTAAGKLAGEGRTCVLEGSEVFERAAVNL